MEYTNQLIHETSPYLLQHAHNPVNWHPWGEEALKKAREENKPILVSIGYAACHWCHVMERESFEDAGTAKLMNENFINIKIDREERPDLDHIYMDAVQAMTGAGGWPLNVFLTPDGKPFFGGTYFPPQRAFNRPSWQETLNGVAQAFRDKRHEIDAQAENLTGHLLQSNAFGLQKTDVKEVLQKERLDEAAENLMKAADKDGGGFGKAPKFPQTFSIQFLLRYSHTKRLSTLPTSASSPSGEGRGEIAPSPNGEGWGEVAPSPNGEVRGEVAPSPNGEGRGEVQALLSLDKMIEGGIYDQLRGGFARYATDNEWLTPHFEKMLYDNALLIAVLSEAYQLAVKERYREVIDETMEFVQAELLHPEGGFYAALDADSEGIEGKFYVWEEQEVKEILGNEAAIFCEYYDVTEKGNWEHRNILRVKKSIAVFAAERKIDPGGLKKTLAAASKKLLEQRNKRVRPQLDDKIILGWNALMNTACSKAFGATGREEYRQLAIRNMNFLLAKFSAGKRNELHHTWKNNQAKYPAFLDDYAFLVQALLQLQEITGDQSWLLRARDITEFVVEHFSEVETGFFFYTPAGQEDVIIRKKEVYDGAVPAGNSVMATNLWHLAILLDREDWKQRSIGMVSSLGLAITRYPGSFGNWACLLQEMVAGTNEIVLLGKNLQDVHAGILKEYIPHRVLMVSTEPQQTFPFFVNKRVDSIPLIYLCSNYTCHSPVVSAKDLMALINSREKG